MNFKKTKAYSNLVFAPGCAFMLYKPDLVDKIHQQLEKTFGKMEILKTCCKKEPDVPAFSTLINVCPGCDKRFENNYKNISTISLWELFDQNDFFSFPDYKGRRMSIIDACPTREKEIVQDAIRSLLTKMNIEIIEPLNTKTKSTCCGSGIYGDVPVEMVLDAMIRRTSEMPENDVVVHCVSCIKSVYNGGKKPQYLPDLMFSEETFPQTYEPDAWYSELNKFIEENSWL
jgi:Fe-S oxidoreductase